MLQKEAYQSRPLKRSRGQWMQILPTAQAPNEPTDITVSFQKGIPTKLVTPQETFTDSVQLFKELNRIGKVHGTSGRCKDLDSLLKVPFS
jgi:argininosuccinate synthase